jgi:SAM-dependent methyltransferase
MIIFQPDRHLLKKFVASHAKEFTGSVVDIGAGEKRYSHLFSHCDSYKTLDVHKESNPDIVASIEKIPLEDSSVDGILCTQVLGDVWDVQQAIQEMIRILKPGGLLLITESLLNEEHDEPQDYWRFTGFAWQKLLEEQCTIEVLEKRGGFHTQAAQQKIRYRIEKYGLYKQKLLGRLAHIWATCIGKFALMRDAQDRSEAGKKFPLGYCILARKK